MNRMPVPVFSHAPRQVLLNALLVGVLVCFCALIGIWTRPSGLLAAFWPANAVLLGLFIRVPVLAHPLSWFAAFIGFLFADLMAGTGWKLSVFLTLGNFAGITVGYWLYYQLADFHRLLKQPTSVMYLVFISLAASMAAGVVGMIGYPYFFNGTVGEGFLYWFATEWANYLAILPVLVTFPSLLKPIRPFRRKRDGLFCNWHRGLAFSTLLLGVWFGVDIGGPGALSFMVPGLLWCALSYRLFTTALLTFFSGIWIMLAVSTGLIDMGVDVRDFYTLESFRLGLSLTALAPLTVASVMNARNELVSQLRFAATHDQLTQVLNRAGLYEKMESEIITTHSYAVLMCDIDYFKAINDQFGHGVGDVVLIEFARRASMCLRDRDLLARVGGEEFCIILTDCTTHGAEAVAKRLCDACSDSPFLATENQIQIEVTVSVGVTYIAEPQHTIESILSSADKALYEAKQEGRNRVVTRSFSQA